MQSSITEDQKWIKLLENALKSKETTQRTPLTKKHSSISWQELMICANIYDITSCLQISIHQKKLKIRVSLHMITSNKIYYWKLQPDNNLINIKNNQNSLFDYCYSNVLSIIKNDINNGEVLKNVIEPYKKIEENDNYLNYFVNIDNNRDIVDISDNLFIFSGELLISDDVIIVELYCDTKIMSYTLRIITKDSNKEYNDYQYKKNFRFLKKLQFSTYFNSKITILKSLEFKYLVKSLLTY